MIHFSSSCKFGIRFSYPFFLILIFFYQFLSHGFFFFTPIPLPDDFIRYSLPPNFFSAFLILFLFFSLPASFLFVFLLLSLFYPCVSPCFFFSVFLFLLIFFSFCIFYSFFSFCFYFSFSPSCFCFIRFSFSPFF